MRRASFASASFRQTGPASVDPAFSRIANCSNGRRLWRDWSITLVSQNFECSRFPVVRPTPVTAKAMPERVRAIAIVSGAPPIADLADHSGLLRLYRWMLKFRRTSSDLVRILFHIGQHFAARRIQ